MDWVERLLQIKPRPWQRRSRAVFRGPSPLVIAFAIMARVSGPTSSRPLDGEVK